MNISHKLIGGIAIVVIPVILVSFFAVLSVETQLKIIGQFHTPALYLIQEMAAQTMEAVEESFAYIASGAEIEKHEFFQWAERLPQQNRTFERLADLDSPKEKLEKELFDGIKTHQADLLRKAERMFSEFESRGGSVGRGVFDDFEETVDALFLRF